MNSKSEDTNYLSVMCPRLYTEVMCEEHIRVKMLANRSVIASNNLHLVTLNTRAQIVQYQKKIHILNTISYLHTWSNMELSDVLSST